MEQAAGKEYTVEFSSRNLWLSRKPFYWLITYTGQVCCMCVCVYVCADTIWQMGSIKTNILQAGCFFEGTTFIIWLDFEASIPCRYAIERKKGVHALHDFYVSQ